MGDVSEVRSDTAHRMKQQKCDKNNDPHWRVLRCFLMVAVFRPLINKLRRKCSTWNKNARIRSIQGLLRRQNPWESLRRSHGGCRGGKCSRRYAQSYATGRSICCSLKKSVLGAEASILSRITVARAVTHSGIPASRAT